MRLDPACERGDIVVGWLTRVVLILAAFGVIAYDVVSIGVAKTAVTDDASSAALAAADSWARTHSFEQAYAAAVTAATPHGDTVVTDSLTIATDGTVSLKLCRTATTLLAFRTSTTKKWALQCGSGQARSVSS